MTNRSSPSVPGWAKERMYQLLVPVVALGLVALSQQTRVAQMLEYGTLDLRFQARAPFDPPADSRLVLVGIDQQSLDKLGAWPWPRHLEAGFMKALVDAGTIPHTVTFDLLFTEDSNRINRLESKTGTDDDTLLAQAAALLPSVVTGALSIGPTKDPREERVAATRTQTEEKEPRLTVPLPDVRGEIRNVFGSDVAVFPVPVLRQRSLFGFVNVDPSPIDRVRHTLPLVVRVADKVYPSMALQTLCQTLSVDPDRVKIDLPGRVIMLKNSSGKTWAIPVNEQGEFTINYRREESFYGVSFVKLLGALLDRTQNGTPLPAACDVRNKVVLVGQTATGLTDLGPTPFQSNSPLIYAHLNVINNVLRNDYLRCVSWPWVVMGWCLVTWITLFRLRHAAIMETLLAPLAVIFLYTIFAFAIFWIWSLQVALVWPILSYGAVTFGAIVLRWREDQRGKQQLKRLFSRMVSAEVLDYLLDHPANLELGGSLRSVTILFSDIRDYTKFSEHIGTEELVRQLNVYFERMVDCVKENRGTFHKFIGDAIMSVWGDIGAVSLGLEEDACNSVRCALMMRRKLRELNEERRADGLMPLRIGIGLNHGEVLVGQIGASIRSEFTVIGDPVNVASRLEGMTKMFHVDLAIGDSVRRLLGDRFLVRRLGLIQLKGKTASIVVYEVFAEKSNPHESSWTEEDVAQYEQAMDAFLGRRFTEAEAGFLACGKKHPEDYCVKRYLEVSREFSVNAVPEDWDGRIVMETK